MPNVMTSATLWPTMNHQLVAIARETIRQHTAPVVEFARTYGHRIPYEHRMELWLAFTKAFPAAPMDADVFLYVFCDVHGLWPAGRRIMPRRR